MKMPIPGASSAQPTTATWQTSQVEFFFFSFQEKLEIIFM